MTGKVPIYPPQITAVTSADNRMRIARPVMGADWKNLGLLNNWLLGRGGPLFACGPVGGVDYGTSETLHFWAWPRAQHHARWWSVALTRGVSDVALTGSFSFNGGASVPWVIPTSHPRYTSKWFHHLEIVDSPSDTPGEVTLTIEHDSNAASAGVLVHGVRCDEVPRGLLEDFGSVKPPRTPTLGSNKLIYDPGDDGSIAAVPRAAVEAIAQARRACLFSAYSIAGVTSTATSYAGTSNVFGTGMSFDWQPAVLARHLANGEDTRTIAWAAYGIGEDGAGEVRVQSTKTSNSRTDTFSDSPGWATGTIEVETDALARLNVDGGIPDGTRERLRVEIRRLTADSVTLYGFFAGEPAS